MSASPLVRVSELQRDFHMGSETVHALAGINLLIAPGEFMGITGPSGSGKSTLLYLLGGLDRPSAGQILVRGQDIGTLDEDALADYRQQTVGFVFQMFNLIPSMTALQNVEFPMRFARHNSADRRQRAAELLTLVGLENRLGHRPTELSGGQQQRVAIARALVNDPDIILADEPTGNLDSVAGGEIIDLLQRLNQEDGRTVIIVSHDPDVIGTTFRALRLHDGRIVNEG